MIKYDGLEKKKQSLQKKHYICIICCVSDTKLKQKIYEKLSQKLFFHISKWRGDYADCSFDMIIALKERNGMEKKWLAKELNR